MELAKWLGAWVLGWGGFLALRLLGADYIRRFPIAALYFVFANMGVWFAFEDARTVWSGALIEGGWVLALTAPLLSLSVYALLRRFADPPHAMMKRYPKEQFLWASYRYAGTKSLEILFQQLLIAALVGMLAPFGLSPLGMGLVFSGIFMLAHLYMFTEGLFFGAFYLIAAAFAGMAFPWLISGTSTGAAWAFLLHWIFYLAGAAWFWTRASKR